MVIGLIVAGAWITLMVIAVALCRTAGRADDLTATDLLDRGGVRAEPRRRASKPAPARESSARVILFP